MEYVRTYADIAQSGNDRKNAALYASKALPVAAITGVVMTDNPSKCSENASTPSIG